MPFEPASVAVIAVVIGLCVGSFLNVVIHRLPKMLERGWQLQCAELAGEQPADLPAYNLVVPRSQCPSCGHGITALENIPVLSFLFLRGRCAACKAPISARYPTVEVLSGLLALAAVLRYGWTPAAGAACILLWSLTALTFIDFDTQLLPDNLTLPLLWAGLMANLAGAVPGVSLRDAVIGAIAGYLSLWSIYWLFKLIRGKEGMGYGDFKLLAALGAWLGWQMLPLIVLLASLVGAVIGIGLVVFKGRDHQIPLAFGPYLAIAGAVALFFGRSLVQLYLPARIVAAYVVGLTGGIGSGKSEVARAFAQLRIDIVDTDALAHRLSAPGQPGFEAIHAVFGDVVRLPSGELDRAALRRLAFADSAVRARLESVLHPLIQAEARREMEAWQGPYGIVVVPLLLERGGLRSIVDRILVVDCPEDEQVRRVVARSGLTAAEVRAIMATQLDRTTRLARADDIVDNSGPAHAIAAQVAELDRRYRQLAAAPRAPNDSREV